MIFDCLVSMTHGHKLIRFQDLFWIRNGVNLCRSTQQESRNQLLHPSLFSQISLKSLGSLVI